MPTQTSDTQNSDIFQNSDMSQNSDISQNSDTFFGLTKMSLFWVGKVYWKYIIEILKIFHSFLTTYDSFCYGLDRSRNSGHRCPDFEALKDPASRDIFSSTSKFARFAKVKPYVLVESEGNMSVKNKKTNISKTC